MVVPLGGGMGPPGEMPPSPELLRFKGPLVLISAGYVVVLVFGLIAGNFSYVVNFLFVLVAALLMTTRADQCMVQCLLPFALFAVMAAFFDIITVISVLTNQSYGARHFFATKCPHNLTVTFTSNTTVYIRDDPYTVMPGTKATAVQDPCDLQWVIGNIGLVIGFSLDVASSVLGYRMIKAVRSMAPGGDANAPMMGGFGGFGGGPGPVPSGPGFSSTGATLGSRPGPQQGAAAQGQGFVPFRGGGQTLGS